MQAIVFTLVRKGTERLAHTLKISRKSLRYLCLAERLEPCVHQDLTKLVKSMGITGSCIETPFSWSPRLW